MLHPTPQKKKSFKREAQLLFAWGQKSEEEEKKKREKSLSTGTHFMW